VNIKENMPDEAGLLKECLLFTPVMKRTVIGASSCNGASGLEHSYKIPEHVMCLCDAAHWKY
jgi:hypothetical protein